MERAELAQRRYARNSPFSYACHACSRCCHDKVIQLNPYEVARLARNRSMSTTEFLARHTERGGTALRRNDQGACVFLTPQGCGVHADRPLVCRLYPLGRHVTSERGEEFRELQPHPETEGEYGIASTVQTFLDRQGAEPFIEAADLYVELVGRLVTALRARGGLMPQPCGRFRMWSANRQQRAQRNGLIWTIWLRSIVQTGHCRYRRI